ncbi:KUP/HAK/KT family potassium transporter [Leifsonia sp. L25]|uniref:KUP/HAK/KT family potassium transporter n=1 Tax=Leifsonia sp. L25 TaxID=3423957 RepID=UPI003D682B24
MPRALRAAVREGVLPLDSANFKAASYFISRGAIRITRKDSMVPWRRSLFVALAHNAANPAARFGLPALRTVTMGSDVEI